VAAKRDKGHRPSLSRDTLQHRLSKARRRILKAQELLEIPGLGDNTVTGLVMLFHPNDFAIYNQQSKRALKWLGRPMDTLEAFQKSIGEISAELGAADFLELDWFLYNRVQAASEVMT